MKKQIKYFLIIFLILGILFFYNLNNSKVIKEHCLMFPALEDCKDKPTSYYGERFNASIENLQEALETKEYAILEKEVFNLNISYVTKEIAGKNVRMIAYNSMIPGPILRVKQNSKIFINVTNSLNDPTTVHWHGLRLQNKFDGVPHTTQKEIMPGESFMYEIDFLDEGIFWYHPHVREDYQQESGLYGNIIIEGNLSNKVDREEFIFLDDIALENGELNFYKDKINHVLMGRFGDQIFINGKEKYELNASLGEVIRFYLTDSANARLFNFSIENHKLKIVGSDMGFYEREFFNNEILLAPSQRATFEIYFNKTGKYKILHKTPDTEIILGTINVVNNNAKNILGKNFNILNNRTIYQEYNKYINSSPNINLSLKMDFVASKMLKHEIHMDHSDETGLEWDDLEMRRINLASSDKSIDWKIIDENSGKANMDINYKWKVGDKIIIKINNTKDSEHPMQHPIHFHGQRFLVLRNNEIPNDNLVWKDSVLVPSGQTITILLEITNPGKWMVHCHIAEHLSDGMMFEFEVKE